MKTTHKEIEVAAKAIYEYYIKSPCCTEALRDVEWDAAVRYSKDSDVWNDVIETSMGEAKAALEAAYAVREANHIRDVPKMVDKWQPIETAPKDTKLWLSSVRARDTHEFIGWWYAPEKTEILSKHEHELFSKHGGWWTYKNNNKPCTYPPTLFQLLPEPPTGRK